MRSLKNKNSINCELESHLSLSMSCLVRRSIITILTMFTGFVFFVSVSSAKQLEFIRDYSYAAGEADSKISCRAIALEQVKRLLLEELGTYLVSNTVIKDTQLSKDEIITYTAGAVVTIIIEERWDGHTYFLKAKIKADDNDVAKSISAIMQNQENSLALEELRKEKSAALKEIERLKKELALSAQNGAALLQDKTNSSNKQKEYDKTIAELSAKEFLEQGIALRNTHKYDLAVEAYSRAQKLAPLWPRPYIGRGMSLLRINKPEKTVQALADFERALQLDSNNAFTLAIMVSLFSPRVIRKRELPISNKRSPGCPMTLAPTQIWGGSCCSLSNRARRFRS